MCDTEGHGDQQTPGDGPSHLYPLQGGGPRVVVSTAAFHARVRGSVPGLGGLKETKLFLPHPRVKVSIVGSLRDREVACSASDRQGSNFESCVWRTVSSQSSHHPQEVLLAQFSLYVHKGGLKPDSFHFLCVTQKATATSKHQVMGQCCFNIGPVSQTLGQYLNSSGATTGEWQAYWFRQIDKLLQIWKKSNLTAIGQITILKCLAMSRIIHWAQNC